MSEGEYTVDDRTMIVKEGSCRLADGTLAGSIIRMNQAVANFKNATGESLDDIWQATSLNAARAIGVADRKGSITRNKDADLILVDDDINVQLTMVEGRTVHQNANKG
jgi:N-acetylglucosamine-6-phosphate deacetylase